MIHVTGQEQVLANLRRYKRKNAKAATNAVEAVAVDVSNHARDNHGLEAHELGRYRSRTGHLTQSIHPSKADTSGNKVSATIHASMEYAAAVEFGHHHIKPYPFFFPALLACRENFKKYYV